MDTISIVKLIKILNGCAFENKHIHIYKHIHMKYIHMNIHMKYIYVKENVYNCKDLIDF